MFRIRLENKLLKKQNQIYRDSISVYEKIAEAKEEKIDELQEENYDLKEECATLRIENANVIMNAKHDSDLTSILNKLADKTVDTSSCISEFSNFIGAWDVTSMLDDSVPRYVDDIVDWWKVIRQEATKAILIDLHWNIKEWLTKTKPNIWDHFYLKFPGKIK